MANPHRGEIEAVLGGTRMTLCLTLGALAELEREFGATDLVELASRFEQGRISADEAIKILGAGLRGAGHALSNQDVGLMQCAGGAAGFIKVVSELLSATFTTAAPRASSDARIDPDTGQVSVPDWHDIDDGA